MDKDIVAFLQESNYIEAETSLEALDQAVKAWKYIIRQKDLTRQNILKTHAILMRDKLPHDQIGAWRKQPVWIGGEQAKHWYAIPDLMDQWIKNASASDKELEIKWDHIMFEQIHPFIDGNGRMGRILLNWQRVKVGLPVLVILESQKQEYYKWFH